MIAAILHGKISFVKFSRKSKIYSSRKRESRNFQHRGFPVSVGCSLLHFEHDFSVKEAHLMSKASLKYICKYVCIGRLEHFHAGNFHAVTLRNSQRNVTTRLRIFMQFQENFTDTKVCTRDIKYLLQNNITKHIKHIKYLLSKSYFCLGPTFLIVSMEV